MAAVQLLGSLLHPPPTPLLPKDAATFAQPAGAVLIHCIFGAAFVWWCMCECVDLHTGQSRSVTVAALYMYYSGRVATLDEAIEWIRVRRRLEPRHPQSDVLQLARELVRRYPTVHFA